MKKILLAVAFIFFTSTLFAQANFRVKGTIERLSKAKTIIIAGSDRFTAPIGEDGSFEISGTITDADFALIFTDSSGADGIWLEPGEYTMHCKEILKKGISSYLFRTLSLRGPKDAEISHGFHQPRYYLGGKNPEEIKAKYRDFSMHYLDSIFLHFPYSKTLPNLISMSQNHIGDDATLTYQSMLSDDQKKDGSSKQLDNYFNRKAKIEKEKFFEDFAMKDEKEKPFLLSSITGKKLIMIDFWSSDCFPCRRKHETMAKWYKKFSSKGLEIVSVSLDKEKTDWLQAIQKDSMNWINVSELKGWETPLADRYFIKSLPYALWLDGDRKIIGPSLSEQEIEKHLE
jgi:thiol-disulfide isomerase/thioredoxin